MASAFLHPLSSLFAPLQALADWFATPAQPLRVSPAPSPGPRQPAQRPPARRLPGQGPVRLPGTAPLRVLRVVRVVEPSAPRSTAGRMVISGRLADVCAELDRLAALELRS